MQRTLDRLGIALLPGDGRARHAFIAVDDVAGAIVAAATAGNGLSGELRLGGPQALSWREVSEVYGRVLGIRVRTMRQPAMAFRALSTLARPLSLATSNLLASMAIVATQDSVYAPEDARRLLGRADLRGVLPAPASYYPLTSGHPMPLVPIDILDGYTTDQGPRLVPQVQHFRLSVAQADAAQVEGLVHAVALRPTRHPRQQRRPSSPTTPTFLRERRLDRQGARRPPPPARRAEVRRWEKEEAR